MKQAATLLTLAQRRAFRRRLLAWFDRNRRALPWRADRDPYRVWVSEIMLQQTRVAVVQERYPDFLQRFPSIAALAAARLQYVLAAWSGLGYYRRARGLHAAARELAKNGGELPRTAEELAELPGIGRYTAAAIASIAFDQPCAAVDGNVERVLGRLLGIDKRSCWGAAAELLDPRRPGDFNQAMMELGATICLPQSPRCSECPVFSLCRTRAAGESRPAAVRRKRAIAYRLAIRERSVFLIQRAQHKSLMPGLWELPSARPGAQAPLLRLRHAITNTDYQVSVYAAKPANSRAGRWIKLSAVGRLPLTGLARKVLRRANLI